MKKINYTVIALLFITFLSYSQSRHEEHNSPGYDTLLFDGADNNSTAFYDKAFDHCYVYVEHVKGNAQGTIMTTKYETICGGQVDTVTYFKKGKVKQGDKLETGEIISTGPDSYLSIMFPDHKTIRLSPNSQMMLNKDYCQNNGPIQILLQEGEMYGDDRLGNQDKKFNVTTKYGTSIVDGTLFTVGTTINGSDTTDILKVYEGSVKFQMLLGKTGINKVSDKGSQLKQLYEDYKNGKITNEEFTKKMQDAQNGMVESLPKEPVHVTAGYKSTILNGANATDPETFDASENRWFDDVNFQ